MDDFKTVWCGNLSDQVTEEILYEFFLQAAPLERVKIPTDREGRKSNFAFITFKHEVSVNYALMLLNGTRLFDKTINVKPRNTQNQSIVRNENSFNQTITYDDLIKRDQTPHNRYEHTPNGYSDARQGSWDCNNYHDREERHNHKPYKKHDYDNRSNDTPNRRRNNYSDRRNNFNDRNSRRNNRHYY